MTTSVACAGDEPHADEKHSKGNIAQDFCAEHIMFFIFAKVAFPGGVSVPRLEASRMPSFQSFHFISFPISSLLDLFILTQNDLGGGVA